MRTTSKSQWFLVGVSEGCEPVIVASMVGNPMFDPEEIDDHLHHQLLDSPSMADVVQTTRPKEWRWPTYYRVCGRNQTILDVVATTYSGVKVIGP